MEIVASIETIAGFAVTLIAGGWLLLREIASQLRVMRQELENKVALEVQQSESRLDARMNKLEDGLDKRQKKLEDGQASLERQVARLGMQVARLEGLLDSLRRPLPEEAGAV